MHEHPYFCFAMNYLADRMKVVSESQTIAMAKKARALAAQGYDVINLSFGEPDFPTPEHICEAGIRAIQEGYTRYTPVAGYPELREVISRKFARENGLHYQPSQIVVSTGAKHSIMNVVMCLVNPGDEVIIPVPYWVSYSEMVKVAGGVPVLIGSKVENDFLPDLNDIKAALNERSKLIIFSSPCNPTGSVFGEAYLRELAELLKTHPQVHVISDEIYEHIQFGGKHFSFASIEHMYDRTITVNGVSKGYAMTGWRIGYIGAPEWLAQACEVLQGQFTSGANAIAQRAAIEALEGDQTPTRAMREIFEKRRDFMLERCRSIPNMRTNTPDGAFYLFPDISAYFGKQVHGMTIQNSQDLCMYLLEEAHVSIVPGSAFGDDHCVRISFAASDIELEKAMDRIELALQKLS